MNMIIEPKTVTTSANERAVLLRALDTHFKAVTAKRDKCNPGSEACERHNTELAWTLDLMETFK